MRRREVIWIIVLAALTFVYVEYFSGWFIKRPILIRVTQRPTRHHHGQVMPIYFVLNQRFKLTSVEVIPINGDKFNPLDPPVWHLVSTSNSVPVLAFGYGQMIRGMKPALNVAPDPLTPGTAYRLLVSAGNLTGSVDFRMKESE